MRIIPGSRGHHYVARLSTFLVIVALIAGMVGCDGPIIPPPPPSQNLEIRDWYDLDAVRDNLGGNHTLMNDLDSTTDGYEDLASPTANQGKGWQPIGTFHSQAQEPLTGFRGSFDGQGYEICDLFINRPDESYVGLFGFVYKDGVIKDISVVNVTETGDEYVGGLVGYSGGTVSNSYSSANVTGSDHAGGLAGANGGSVSNSYSSANVTGYRRVGGLMGENSYGGSVSNSYSTSNVIGNEYVGGLVGANIFGTVSTSYSTGSVTGGDRVGGLVGQNGDGTVSNSYSSSNVTGWGWYVGGLVGWNSDGTVSNSYSTGSVTGYRNVGGLVGFNLEGDDGGGTVSNSYSTGSVTGHEYVGGLVGRNYEGNVSKSYSTGSVTGDEYVGGLVGDNSGTVSNSFWDTQTSGQAASAGGTGKNTAEMKDIATFSSAGWNIVEVADPGTRNPSYVWNIVDDVTYPFLNWQP